MKIRRLDTDCYTRLNLNVLNNQQKSFDQKNLPLPVWMKILITYQKLVYYSINIYN